MWTSRLSLYLIVKSIAILDERAIVRPLLSLLRWHGSAECNILSCKLLSETLPPLPFLCPLDLASVSGKVISNEEYELISIYAVSTGTHE